MSKNEGRYGSGSGESQFYVVEARVTNGEPRVLHGVLVTQEWRRLAVRLVPHVSVAVAAEQITVPAPTWPNVSPAELGLLDRAAAYALSARFQLDDKEYSVGHAALCVETRLVEVKLSYRFSVEEIGVCEPLSLFDHLRGLKSTPRALEASQSVAAVDPSVADTVKPTTRV